MSEQAEKCCVCGAKATMLVMEKDDVCPEHPVCDDCQDCFVVVFAYRFPKTREALPRAGGDQ